MILHCVRAFEETLRLLKEEKCKVPVIFHGFSKGAIIAKQLIDKGYYLSFGKLLFDVKTASVFKAIPLKQIFLETDVGEIGIESIYQRAAFLNEISLDALADFF